MGDFNYPEISYKDNTAKGIKSPASRFLRTTQDLFLTQYISEPTRMREGAEPSTLDYIFIHEDNLIRELQFESPLGKSDHVVITWQTVIEVTTTESKVQKRNFWKGNYTQINKALSDIDRKSKFSGKSVEEKWNFFMSTLEELIETHVPLKKAHKKRKVYVSARKPRG